MKSEYEIAKENVERGVNTLGANPEAKEHKQTCQRFLDFLESLIEKYEPNIIWNMPIEMKDKITDLKQAIKHYEENGI